MRNTRDHHAHKVLSIVPGPEQGLLLLLESEGSRPHGHVSSRAFDFAGLLTSAFLGPLTVRSLWEHIRLEFKLTEEGLFTNEPC